MCVSACVRGREIQIRHYGTTHRILALASSSELPLLSVLVQLALLVHAHCGRRCHHRHLLNHLPLVISTCIRIKLSRTTTILCRQPLRPILLHITLNLLVAFGTDQLRRRVHPARWSGVKLCLCLVSYLAAAKTTAAAAAAAGCGHEQTKKRKAMGSSRAGNNGAQQ